jgi:Domain of unknown function (DUF4205)
MHQTSIANEMPVPKSSLSKDDSVELTNIVNLLWENSNFWSIGWQQGFIFSQEEPSALVQCSGGPCSVIATVQSYLLKHLMDLPAINQFKGNKD